jgi:hypothetical protein
MDGASLHDQLLRGVYEAVRWVGRRNWDARQAPSTRRAARVARPCDGEGACQQKKRAKAACAPHTYPPPAAWPAPLPPPPRPQLGDRHVTGEAGGWRAGPHEAGPPAFAARFFFLFLASWPLSRKRPELVHARAAGLFSRPSPPRTPVRAPTHPLPGLDADPIIAWRVCDRGLAGAGAAGPGRNGRTAPARVHSPLGSPTTDPPHAPSPLSLSLFFPSIPDQGMYEFATDVGILQNGELPEVRMHGAWSRAGRAGGTRPCVP